MSLKGILIAIVSYRLKYNITRRYPGKWTTPLVLIFFAAVTAFLALLNISLAGQDIVQEFTAHPNDTSSDLPFNGLLPSLLRPSPGDFTPTTFKLGDILQTNMSIFDYEIIEAFDDDGLPILSFPWSNNPFSSCDVSEIHPSFPPMKGSPSQAEGDQIHALITCWFPVNITLSVGISFKSMWSGRQFMGQDVPWPLTIFRDAFFATGVIPGMVLGGANITRNYGWINPCCLCQLNFTEPHLRYTDIELENLGGWYYKSVAHPACDDSIPARLFYNPSSGLPSVSETIVHNTIQSFFHLLRLDLGIIRPNQIYTSPEVFNRTMVPWPMQYMIDAGMSPDSFMVAAAAPQFPPIPQAMLDASLDVAVPKAVYLRPQFRPKPLPSSVFVATITMVGTIWKVFSLIAGIFVDSTLDDIDRTRSVEMMEEGDGSGVELLRGTRRASE